MNTQENLLENMDSFRPMLLRVLSQFHKFSYSGTGDKVVPP